MPVRYVVSGVALMVLLLAACSRPEAAAPVASATVAAPTPAPTAVQATEPEAAEETASEEASNDESASDAVSAEDEAMAETDATSQEVARPAWQQLPLTNARTGESFTLADFAGKTVYVEPFATWCTNCRRQIEFVNEVRANFGDDVVFIALSVEPNIGDAALVQYANDQGFDLIFAAMSPELLRETVAIFGQTITNPPATPHFVIRADGSTTDLFTGIESPDEIIHLIQSSQG